MFVGNASLSKKDSSSYTSAVSSWGLSLYSKCLSKKQRHPPVSMTRSNIWKSSRKTANSQRSSTNCASQEVSTYQVIWSPVLAFCRLSLNTMFAECRKSCICESGTICANSTSSITRFTDGISVACSALTLIHFTIVYPELPQTYYRCLNVLR